MNPLDTVFRRLRTLLRLGVLTRSDSSQAVQSVQVVVGDETLTDIEHIEPYGYTSRPHASGEVLLVALKGNPGHSLALQLGGRKFRVKDLAEGEVALYDDLGNRIHFMRDKIKVNATTHLEASAPTTELISTVKITGSLQVTDDITCDKTVTATSDCIGGGVSLKNHLTTGVTPGGGLSGKPQ